MSVQLDRIRTLLSTMYFSNSENTGALDEGIRRISNFSGIDDLTRTIAIEANFYKLQGKSSDTFLRERCGIDLTNADTGAITGQDAGGTLKTASSVVPETLTNYYYPNPGNSNWWAVRSVDGSGTVSNLKVVYHSGLVQSLYTKIQNNNNSIPSNLTANERILLGLSSWWIGEGLKVVEDAFGAGLAATGKTWTLYVNINSSSDMGAGTLANTNTFWKKGTDGIDHQTYAANSIVLRINIDRYAQIVSPTVNANGYSASEGNFYLDRVMAHEFTHAILSALLTTKHDSSPVWFQEGIAELANGCDDTRTGALREVAGNISKLQSGLHRSSQYDNTNYEYPAGYIALRYLAHAGGSPAAGSTFMEVSQAHYSSDLSTLVATGNVSGQVWLDNQHGVSFASTVRNIDASTCTGSNNILAGNSTDNIIISGSGSASLWGGVGGNDVLRGGSGADMFWYGNGEGNDIIQNSGAIDSVMLYSPMNFESIDVSGNDLHVGIGGGSSLTVQNWNESSSVNTFQLWDGSKWGLHKNASGSIECYQK
ncbi:MAG: hypothetical protein IJT01_00805 [Selenomonadaceae bacterium]|nr:hypothetical protein [Selenomonadaceae bacterium]